MTVAFVDAWKEHLLRQWQNRSDFLGQELQLPAWTTLVEAAAAAYSDSKRAISSTWQLLFLVGQPVFLLLKLILKPIVWRLAALLCNVATLLQQYAIPWLIRHGGAQIRSVAVQVYRFHLSRTRDELLLEAGICVLFFAIYKLYQHVKTQKWVTRSKAFVRRQGRRIAQCYSRYLHQVIDAYHRLVNRIATVSQALAVALPHLLYWICGAALWTMQSKSKMDSLAAALMEYLATQTPLIPLLQVGYPMLETMSCILQASELMSTTTPTAPMTMPPMTRSRSSNNIDNNAASAHSNLRHRLHNLLDYWILYAAWQLLGAFVWSLPLVSKVFVLQGLKVGHLWLAIWVAAILRWTLSSHDNTNDENANSSTSGTRSTYKQQQRQQQTTIDTALLLQWPAGWVLDHVVGGSSQYGLHGIVSVDAWQKLLGLLNPFLSLAELMRLISASTRNQLVHVLQELRVLVVPLCMCFVPFVSPWAVRYTQWIIPMSRYNKNRQTTTATTSLSSSSSSSSHSFKSSGRSIITTKQPHNNLEESVQLLILAAQYWILHFSFTGLGTFFGFSRLLPFNLLRFLAWWYLSWPTSIAWIWAFCGRESNLVVDILLGEATPTDSCLVRAIHAIVEKLPKAATVVAATSTTTSIQNAGALSPQQRQQQADAAASVIPSQDGDDPLRLPLLKQPQPDDDAVDLGGVRDAVMVNGDVSGDDDLGDGNNSSLDQDRGGNSKANKDEDDDYLPSDQDDELDENASPSTVNQTPAQQQRPLRRSHRSRKGK